MQTGLTQTRQQQILFYFFAKFKEQKDIQK